MRIAATIIILLSLFTLPAVAQQRQQADDEIRRSIFFGGGSYYIEEGQIGALYEWLDSIPNLLDKYQIHLISHTDPIGGKQYNEWLSQKRSEAVQQIILQKNIPEHKITITNWGLENPVYTNDSWAGMQMNRRVDVILYPVVF
jgi:outer membrane protein OmpA-like peptidoglycan-associated protein